MIDIDFRYVMREVPDTTGGHREKVLQWRKKVRPSDGSFCIALHSDGTSTDLSGEWTEWQDVRTEEE